MKNRENKPPIDNTISDETGEFDVRFVLWRHFCLTNNIPVETLPSQLDDERKEEWEALKTKRLGKRGRSRG